MREWFDRIPRPVIVIGVLIVVWQLWRAFMPLPPAWYIRWTYPQASPAVSNATTGEVIASDGADGTVVDGIYPLSSFVVVAYHVGREQRYSVLEKGWFWWRSAISAGYSLDEPQEDAQVAYKLETVAKYRSANGDIARLHWAQLLAGWRIDPAVQRVQVTFDDGTTQEAPVIDERFIIFSTEHGAGCELTTLGTNGEPLRTERLEAFRLGSNIDADRLRLMQFDPADFDCAGVW